MYDVAIIGAGVCGALIGRELAKYKLSVIILEKENDVAMGATKANSAIIHAGFDAKSGLLKAKLNVAGSKLMPKLVEELGVKYKNIGALVVAYNEEELSSIEKLFDQGKINGVEGLEIIGPDKLFSLEPNITKEALGALFAPTSAIISPYGLTIAAIGNAMDNGVELKLNFDVNKIEDKSDFYVLYSAKENVETKYIINATGIFADTVAALVGNDDIKITPRRGEYMLLDKDCAGIVKHTIFRAPTKMGKGILYSPTVDGNTILGPTAVNIDDKEDKSTTIGGLAKVKEETLFTVPSTPMNKVITSFCGLRAVGNTGDFIINSPVRNFINVAGIESPGLSSSPAIALYVVDLLKENGCELEANPNFNPIREPIHRFKMLPDEQKNEIIKKDGRFGKIVCRCESVSEGEIVSAIHANPRATDLDALKRRLRSGMGRCQGGFCTPFIAEILMEELGLPIEKITKAGSGSNLIVGRTK